VEGGAPAAAALLRRYTTEVGVHRLHLLDDVVEVITVAPAEAQGEIVPSPAPQCERGLVVLGVPLGWPELSQILGNLDLRWGRADRRRNGSVIGRTWNVQRRQQPRQHASVLTNLGNRGMASDTGTPTEHHAVALYRRLQLVQQIDRTGRLLQNQPLVFT